MIRAIALLNTTSICSIFNLNQYQDSHNRPFEGIIEVLLFKKSNLLMKQGIQFFGNNSIILPLGDQNKSHWINLLYI